MAEVHEPSVLLCPITHAMYRDPVFVTESGNTYERAAISQWCSKTRRDPLTNVDISGLWYTNWQIRREVMGFLEEHPGYTPQGWEDRAVPPASSPEPRRWKGLSFWILSFVVSLAAILAHLRLESPYYWPDIESEDTDVTYLKCPKGSRLEAWKVSGRLVIKIPAPGFQASVIFQMIFSLLWIAFVFYWSRAAWSSGVRMIMPFSLPFWVVGLMLFFNTLLTPSLSQTLTASPLEYQLKSQVLQLAVSRVAAKVTDLEELPSLVCSNESDCRLVLQDGVTELVFGSDLQPVEVRWIQKQLCSHWGMDISKCLQSATYIREPQDE